MTVTEEDQSSLVEDIPQPVRASSPATRVRQACPFVLVGFAVVYNLVVVRAERLTVRQLNDTGVHASMVQWAADRIRHGHNPLDGWFPTLSLGLPQFHHYQSLPHTIAGAFSALTGLGAAPTVAWSDYLLLSLWPVCLFLSARLIGIDRWAAAGSAVLAPVVISVTGYGYEHGSYVWRGNGVWSQLWGMWLLPLAIAFCWRAIRTGRGYTLAALFLGATIACHFITGYLALVLLAVWVLVEPREFWRRVKRAALVGAGAALISAWVIVPLLLDSKFSARTEYNVGTFWSDSFGGRKVLGWLVSGELFDHGRWPVISVLIAVGILVSLRRARADEVSRGLLGMFGLTVLLFSGRDTIGFIVNRMPGGRDLLLHRFIIGVHLSGLLLAGVGAAAVGQAIGRQVARRRPSLLTATAVALSALLLVALVPGWRQLAHFNALNAHWINQQRAVDSTSGRDFDALDEQAIALGGGRIYAGSAAAFGKNIRVGDVPGFAALLKSSGPDVGFTLRTVSLSSDIETRFDDSNPAQFDLLNIRYVIFPAGRQPLVPATQIASRGPWVLWGVNTSGYLQVVDTTAALAADRTNLGKQVDSYLRSQAFAGGQVPLIAFDGDHAALPTLNPGSGASGPAGAVEVQYDDGANGTYGGVVTATRPSVVMLKATYDPRWEVKVDGQRVRSQMLAPSFIGAPVGPGRHTVTFTYREFPNYWLLLLIGALTVVGFAVIPRYWHRRHRPADDTGVAVDV